jgi:hypothetical protein
MNAANVANLAPFGAIALAVGLFLFFRGFRDLRRKRLLEDTPTSTLRAIAPGLVEVSGRASKAPYKAPLRRGLAFITPISSKNKEPGR